MSDGAVLDRAYAAMDRYDPRHLSPVADSVRAQLAYLSELVHGRGDPARLHTIILGVQAAKEFDGYPEIADPLFAASALARRLQQDHSTRRRAWLPRLLRRFATAQEQERS